MGCVACTECDRLGVCCINGGNTTANTEHFVQVFLSTADLSKCMTNLSDQKSVRQMVKNTLTDSFCPTKPFLSLVQVWTKLGGQNIPGQKLSDQYFVHSATQIIFVRQIPICPTNPFLSDQYLCCLVKFVQIRTNLSRQN